MAASRRSSIPTLRSPGTTKARRFIGAVVVAYSQTAAAAQKDRKLLGTEIAYYDAQTVATSSFTKGATTEKTATRASVSTRSSSRARSRRTQTTASA